MINGLKNNWKLNESNLGKSISVIGRVWHKEVSDNQILLYLFDKTTIYTCQFKKELQTAKQVTNETFIKVNGVISKASFKTFHLDNVLIFGNEIQILSDISESDEDVKKNLSSIRFLFIRKPEIKYILEIKRKIRKYLTNHLENQGYSLIETPVITSFPQIDRKAIRVIISQPSNLYAKDKFLIQKSLYYIEAFAHSFNKVFTITPAFRADHRESNYLLAEFWLIEVEEIFSSMKEQMNIVEETMKYISSQLLKNDYSLLENLIRFRELGKLNKNELVISKLSNEFWEKVESEIKKYFIFLQGVNKTYPRLKYKEVEEAFIKNNEFITTTHIRERRGNILTSKYQSPIFVYEFPYEKRHFYDKKCPVDNQYTHSFDLIGHNGYGEIASGGEREYKAEIVEKQIKEKRFRLENNHTLHWYHASKKYGSVPHAGFSIGLERLTSWITQTDHISNTIGFPRRIIGTDLQY